MQTISLCMIVKNEESTIDNCLKSIYDLVDEIIIIDTGSTDKTKEICLKYTNKIYDYEWDYDFSKARNYSFSFAKCNYIMWLDADDILYEIDRNKLKLLKNSMNGDIDVYLLTYNYRHNSAGKCTYSFPRERILKNNRQLYWTCIVHELLNFGDTDKIVETDIVITHTNNNDNGKSYINFFEKKISLGHKLNTREKYFYGGELYIFNYIDKAIENLESFVSSNDYCNYYELCRAHNYLGDCYKKKKIYIKAIHNYICQISYDEPNMTTYFDIAQCYQNLNEYKKALFYYNSIVELTFRKEKLINNSVYDIENCSSYIQNLKINALLSMCIIYYNLGDISNSLLCNNKILIIDPKNPYALYNYNYFNCNHG